MKCIYLFSSFYLLINFNNMTLIFITCMSVTGFFIYVFNWWMIAIQKLVVFCHTSTGINRPKISWPFTKHHGWNKEWDNKNGIENLIVFMIFGVNNKPNCLIVGGSPQIIWRIVFCFRFWLWRGNLECWNKFRLCPKGNKDLLKVSKKKKT